MPIFYIDPENGSDAGTGADWANAWETVTSGATALRIAAGDEIRIAKSPDPTSLGIDATFTEGSDEITLASALTKEIVNGGETWTPSADVTFALDTERKVGTNCSKHTFASGFTTGLASYYALGGTEDFSGYEQISIQVFTNVAIAANTLSIRLCSDAAGVTTVDTIVIPAVPETLKYHTFTVDTGGALGASIQSVALYADLDPGTPAVQMTQIIACKASADADSLSLSSLISKSSDPLNLEWYAIRGIIGTTVYLDYVNEYNNPDNGKYTGGTVTTTGYKRECFKTTPATNNNTYANIVNDTGTPASPLVYSYGWNTSTTLQDGMTFFDGQNSEGTCFYTNNRHHINIYNLGMVRYYYGYRANSAGFEIKLYNISISCMNSGFYASATDSLLVDNIFAHGASSALQIGNSATMNDAILTGNSVGLSLSAKHSTILLNSKIVYSSSNDISLTSSSIRIDNTVLGSSVEIGNLLSTYSTYALSNNHDQTEGNHWQFYYQGTVNSQTTTRHTASGIAWEILPNSDSSIGREVKFKVADVLVEADSEATATVWVKKEHATNVDAKLIIEGGFIAGVASDVEDVKADDTDWEQLSISFTPTETGVVPIYVWGWYVAGENSVYVDDFNITQ